MIFQSRKSVCFFSHALSVSWPFLSLATFRIPKITEDYRNDSVGEHLNNMHCVQSSNVCRITVGFIIERNECILVKCPIMPSFPRSSIKVCRFYRLLFLKVTSMKFSTQQEALEKKSKG